MIELPIKMIADATCSLNAPRYDLQPIQLGMPTPWHVAIASMVRLHTKKNAAKIVQDLFTAYPSPAKMKDATLEHVRLLMKRLPLKNRIASNIVSMCQLWCAGAWSDLRDLPGCGVYVCDCVGYFCFGCADVVTDELQAYIRTSQN